MQCAAKQDGLTTERKTSGVSLIWKKRKGEKKNTITLKLNDGTETEDQETILNEGEKFLVRSEAKQCFFFSGYVPADTPECGPLTCIQGLKKLQKAGYTPVNHQQRQCLNGMVPDLAIKIF